MLDRQKKCPGFRQDLNPRYPDREPGALSHSATKLEVNRQLFGTVYATSTTTTDLKNKK